MKDIRKQRDLQQKQALDTLRRLETEGSARNQFKHTAEEEINRLNDGKSSDDDPYTILGTLIAGALVALVTIYMMFYSGPS